MPNRLGLQPARIELARQRWSIRQAAEEIGVLQSHLSHAVTGYCPPSLRVRERLPILLSKSLNELFHADALAREYAGARRTRAQVASMDVTS